MADWQPSELRRITDAEELHISVQRTNGTTRPARPIWAVRVDDSVYVRAAYGAGGAWHRIARETGRAEISAPGLTKQVAVEDAATAVLDRVDQAYREKYGRRYASIVDSINGDEPRASTLRLSPIEGV